MTKRKIGVVTGTRAEYGLLYWVIKQLQADQEIDLQLLVTGTHLSTEFGNTYQQIEADGFTITRKLDIQLDSDTPQGISRSMGIALTLFGHAFAELQPDLILLLGDRFEIFAAAAASTVAGIPITHCHGGELTEGAIDDAFRHSITKMAHLHFTATEIYRKRVIQLGEPPNRVFNVGGLGIENINRLKLLSRETFEEAIGFKLKAKNLLITFHPVTLEKASSAYQFSELLEVLEQQRDTGLIFTYPNSDTDGRVIIQLIKDFVRTHSTTTVAFESLGQLRYLSALKHVNGVIGNSSSGILEAPSFKIGTLNIGDRQKGRLKAASVIDCLPERKSIADALTRLYSESFNKQLMLVENPYGTVNASEQIVRLLKDADLATITRKSFYDL